MDFHLKIRQSQRICTIGMLHPLSHRVFVSERGLRTCSKEPLGSGQGSSGLGNMDIQGMGPSRLPCKVTILSEKSSEFPQALSII
jgi:hypothetical protein